jgi:hypothetical protein
MTEEDRGGSPKGEAASRLVTRVTIVLGGLGLIWWGAAVFRSLSQPMPPELEGTVREWSPPPSLSRAPARYLGAASCRECHPGETAGCSRAGHARTLRPAASHPIAQWLDGRTVADPELASVEWSYRLREGKLSVERREHGTSQSFPIDYCVGSGRIGVTFVAAMSSGPGSPPVGIEHRLSYLTMGKKLGITPGQQNGGVTDPWTRIVTPGRYLPAVSLLRCFKCHSTVPSSQDRDLLDTATMIPDVTCERCHGPAAEHVEAARRGDSTSELAMRLGLESASPAEQITACGECHRSPASADGRPFDPDDLQIVRFQPIGLSQSKCFQKGQSGLRCTSCHDPHVRVSRNTAAYEAVCLECHRVAEKATRLCPVQTAKGCVECHMPRRGITPEFVFTDHWIRVPTKTAAIGTHQ